MLFLGTVTINQGKLQINGQRAISTAAGVTLNSSGTLSLNRGNSIGSTNVPMIFNGGKLQANSLTNNLNASDTFGTLVISNNSSSIDLDPANANHATLIFAGGSLAGSGTLTINGWTGTLCNSGTDDRIFVASQPSAAFLNAIQFTSYPPGAVRLATGEIVPNPGTFVWNGLGADDNWSSVSNWVSTAAPCNNGTVPVEFGGTTRLAPVTDVNWDVLGVNYNGSAGAFVNSGSQLTIRGQGITNNSASQQTISNNVVMAAPQTWNAAAGPLAFGGMNNNGGFTPVIDGGFGTTFLPGSGLSGSGGLVKNGAGTLTVSAPMTFAGPITLNSGFFRPDVNNVGGNQPIILNGGTFSGVSKSQTFGSLTLTTDSAINFDPGDGAGVLTFASGSRTGGTLTINSWTGVGGVGGTDDKIVLSADPGTNFLSAIQFTGFPAGAVYLAGTGEIVPPGVVQPVQPTLASPIRLSNTAFQFTVIGTAGQSYTIQYSTTLTTWDPILTTNAPSDSFEVVDPNATNSFAFYRVYVNP